MYMLKRGIKQLRPVGLQKMNFEYELVNNIKTDSKSFWSYIRSNFKTKSGIADLEAHDGSMLTSDIQKADLLNRFFVSVFTDEDLNSVPDFPDKNIDSTLECIAITQEQVEKKLQKLNTSKAPGMDSIHPHELCGPITSLFDISLSTGVLPDKIVVKSPSNPDL